MSIKNKLSNIFIFLVAVIQHDKPFQTNTSKQSIKDEVIHLC